MIEHNPFEYIAVVLTLLLGVSLYANFRLSKIIKKSKQESDLLMKDVYFNPLSELPNRMNVEIVLSEQIERVHRHKQVFLVTALNVKNYVVLKEKYSQKFADKLIREVSNRLLFLIRDEDIVGHIREDLFVIVFNEYLSEDNHQLILDRIETAFQEQFQVENQDAVTIEMAIGESKYPDDAKDAKALIDLAVKRALK